MEAPFKVGDVVECTCASLLPDQEGSAVPLVGHQYTVAELRQAHDGWYVRPEGFGEAWGFNHFSLTE
jgi:hypothetical protein